VSSGREIIQIIKEITSDLAPKEMIWFYNGWGRIWQLASKYLKGINAQHLKTSDVSRVASHAEHQINSYSTTPKEEATCPVPPPPLHTLTEASPQPSPLLKS
jgi:hypothetical protein